MYRSSIMHTLVNAVAMLQRSISFNLPLFSSPGGGWAGGGGGGMMSFVASEVMIHRFAERSMEGCALAQVEYGQ